MSEQGTVGMTDAAAALDKEVAEMAARFEKKGKVIALSTDDHEAFAALVSKYGDNVKDFTDGVDATAFTGMALTKTDNGRIALIPIASEEAVFADAVVRKALYKLYVNKVANAGMDDETQAAQFIIPAGLFKQKFDVDAFKFLAKTFVKFLREQGLLGITINSLRQSFQSAAFAKTQFPRTTDEQWVKILGMAKALAEKNNKDVSLYDHWEATRSVQEADTSTLNLDFAKLQNMEEALDGEDETEEPAKS